MWKFNDTPHSMKTWCELAASYIRFPPDRPAVEQELMEHLQDKVDDFMEHGMPQAEAERRAVQEMGEPRETGLLLRQIHKPYLGWVWKGTCWLVKILLLVVFAWTVVGIFDLRDTDGLHFASYDPFAANYYESETSRSERVFYSEPRVSDSSDGYRFTVQKVAYWEGTYTDELGRQGESNRFGVLMTVTNFKPWAGYSDVPRWFHAVDSLGNYYYSNEEYVWTNEPSLSGNGTQTGPFTYTWHLWANNYVSQEAEWIELRYERDGRDVALRIDLTGGEDA